VNREQMIAKAHDELRGKIGEYAETRFETLIERGVDATIRHCQAAGASVEADVRSRRGLRARAKQVAAAEKPELDRELNATRGIISVLAFWWTCYQAWQFLKLVIRWAFDEQEAAIQSRYGMR
jgi:hypothetical protein